MPPVSAQEEERREERRKEEAQGVGRVRKEGGPEKRLRKRLFT